MSFAKLLLLLPEKLTNYVSVDKKQKFNVVSKFLSHIRSAILYKKPYINGAINALSVISQSKETNIHFTTFIPLLFQLPLSMELFTVLSNIHINVDGNYIKKIIETELLSKISQILLLSETNNNNKTFLKNTNSIYDITLCLYSLSHFAFSKMDNIKYIRYIEQYMMHNDWKVRKATALAVIHLYIKDEHSDNPTKSIKEIMHHTMKLLIPLACTDPEGDIKYELLRELNKPIFYIYIVQV